MYTVYCDRIGCHVLCLRHGILQCSIIGDKVPILQADTVVIISFRCLK